MQNIVQSDHPVLRQKALPVTSEEVPTERLRTILADMKAALDNESDGAALAAPQIGIPLRIFIVSERVFGKDHDTKERNKEQHFVYINPVITRRSRKQVLLDEGCLSVRGKYGNIKRAARATVQACDEHGKPFTRGASGLLAQVFQHECDHLDGTLFIDKAENLWAIDMPEKK